MRSTSPKSQSQLIERSQILDLAFAKLAHPIHFDADPACPLCIADELEAKAQERIEDLRQRDPFAEADGGRLLGQLMSAAYKRADLAEMLREGDARLILIERSAAFGLSLRFEEAR